MVIFMSATRPKHGGIAGGTDGLENRSTRASAGGQTGKLPQDSGFCCVHLPAACGQKGFVDAALVDRNVLNSSIEPASLYRRKAQRGPFQCCPYMCCCRYFCAVQYEVGEADILSEKDRVRQIVNWMHRLSFNVREPLDGWGRGLNNRESSSGYTLP